jgi:Protein of unknown function (DUF3160)
MPKSLDRWVVVLVFAAACAAGCRKDRESVSPLLPDAALPAAGTGGSGRGGAPSHDAGSGGAGGAAPAPVDADPSDAVALMPAAATTQELARLKAKLGALPKTAAELASAHQVTFLDKLPYDPKQASFLDKIQASKLALNPAELAALSERGFALTGRPKFLNFVHGYRAIYQEHLPVYVSADSILYAVHRSYDTILRTLEENVLVRRLTELLEGMRARLPSTTLNGVSQEAVADVDLHLAVALSLLTGKTVAPVAGADAAAIAMFVDRASAETGGWEKVPLFGLRRDFDFSQFKPRGHYTRSISLGQYFRAMMWLGRVDFRLIETEGETGRQLFRRRQLEAALVEHNLIDAPALARWKTIDDVVRAFVGEPDNMTLQDVGAFVKGEGGDVGGLLAKPDEALAQALINGGFGVQRIASQIIVNGIDKTLPLHRAFMLFGQRYIIDSHVFSNVTYARVKDGDVKRLMPNPLDAAFAALGNDAAVALLAPELAKYDYASELASVRALADEHGAEFWGGNLYNLWLSALRSLAPNKDLKGARPAGLPSVAATEPWSRRMLNAQLGSWAELRHDTILYAKQSYTDVPACEYPDAYVEPYPEFWAKLAEYGRKGKTLIAGLGLTVPNAIVDLISAKFAKLEEIATMLKDMADRQRAGTPFTPSQLAFINQAVSVEPFGCAQLKATGWYAELFYDPTEVTFFDPTIADVHTQPADEGGTPVGKVLHVGTGMPRQMVVTVDGCSGPRAYVGLASSYYETITKDFNRLDDPSWAKSLMTAEPDDVPWMKDLVTR